MNRNLLILGAGGLGRVAKEIAEAMGCFEKIDFLDDVSEAAVGAFRNYKELAGDYSYAAAAVENAELRLRWIQRLEDACFQIAVLVHPNACVSPSAQLMKGTIVESLAVVQANSTVAVGCILSSGAVVRQNSFIGDVCRLGCNAVVNEGNIVLARTEIECCTVYPPASRDRMPARDEEEKYCCKEGDTYV